jgi:hypothetical protein
MPAGHAAGDRSFSVHADESLGLSPAGGHDVRVDDRAAAGSSLAWVNPRPSDEPMLIRPPRALRAKYDPFDADMAVIRCRTPALSRLPGGRDNLGGERLACRNVASFNAAGRRKACALAC